MHLMHLEEKGYIQRDPSKPRTIKILKGGFI
ncbi:LexA family protein [Proteus mirabilis]